MRVSLVSADTALCDGPRNEAQSLVTAPLGSGFGLRCTRAWPNARTGDRAGAASACSTARRDIKRPILDRAFGEARAHRQIAVANARRVSRCHDSAGGRLRSEKRIRDLRRQCVSPYTM